MLSFGWGRGRRSDHSTGVQVHMRIRTTDVLVHEQRSVQRESLNKAGIMSGGGGSGWWVGSKHCECFKKITPEVIVGEGGGGCRRNGSPTD